MFIQVTNAPPPLKRATPKIGGSEGGAYRVLRRDRFCHPAPLSDEEQNPSGS